MIMIREERRISAQKEGVDFVAEFSLNGENDDKESDDEIGKREMVIFEATVGRKESDKPVNENKTGEHEKDLKKNFG